MDAPRFDRLTTLLATVGTRRTLTLLLAALPLSGISRPDQEASAAKPQRRRRRQRSRSRERVAGEKKRRRTQLCFNGETILAKKRKKRKLLKQGATHGECPPSPPPSPPPPPPGPCAGVVCGAAQRCCQGVCQRLPWGFQAQIGAGTAGSGTNQFNRPLGVDITPDGLTAWVADTFNARVMVWTRPNASSTTWSFQAQIGTGVGGSGTDQFSGPFGVAVTPDGLTAWVADTNNHRVMVWTRPNASSTTWSFQAQIGTGTTGSGTDQFSGPSGVGVSADGLTVWVADSSNNRVMVWTRPNASSAVWSFNAQLGTGVGGTGTDQFAFPSGVAVSADGLTVWVADANNDRVMVWTRPNASSTTWSFQAQLGTGTTGSGTDQFNSPFGVAVTPDGLTAWMADSNNDRVMVWTRPNASSTTWSFQTQIGSGTAGSGNTQFNDPERVAVTPDGLTVWVADTLNHRVVVWGMESCPP